MTTTKEMIREWLKKGRKEKATHMIVATDTFDWTDYPVYVHIGEDVRKIEKQQEKVMEVYHIEGESKDSLEAQVNSIRSFKH